MVAMEAKNSTRKRISKKVIAQLLVGVRRRCCLCVGLNRSYDIKRLQIAHIDRDRTNNSSNNLVPICLDHHDQYDSKTSQSKGITSEELHFYYESWLREARLLFPIFIEDSKPIGVLHSSVEIPSGDYQVYRKGQKCKQKHELLEINVDGYNMTVRSPEWVSIGFLRGDRYVGRFKYHRGWSPTDTGTHDLIWDGCEFTGGVRYDNGFWGCEDLIWRPLNTSIKSKAE